ncbi:MAG: PD40 domain-containing protein [Chloroflexi bacterium]|nr:PD40 domain-containing protein [Chloroflexota bacterium]
MAFASGPAILQLTDDHAADVRPAWSPDNKTIAYQSNREGAYHIYLVNADGSNPRALTKGSSDDRHPIWMPDGKAILFDSFDGSRREIWMVNVLDGNLKQLTNFGALASFPAPSPDGQWISFYVFKDESLDLWIARRDGRDAKPLTRELASARNNQCTFACHYAAWNADNRTIAYSAGELDTIWTVDREAGSPKRVVADGADNHFPWFLPDGRLGYVTEHIEPAAAWTDAWALDLKTGQRTLLQSRMSMQGPVEWNNDNTKVLFHSPRGGNFDIYLIDLGVSNGVEALQGKPIPSDRIQKAATPASPVATSPAPTQQTDLGLLTWVFLGTIGVFTAGLVWRILRRQSRR